MVGNNLDWSRLHYYRLWLCLQFCHLTAIRIDDRYEASGRDSRITEILRHTIINQGEVEMSKAYCIEQMNSA